jgi:RiboL-PSP-HEPN
MKIRTTEELQIRLDEDFAWRRKELTAIYTNVQASKPLQLNTNIRIGVVMLYAHWEGFIKNAAENYLIFVACKKLNLSQLNDNMIAVSLKSKLKEFEEVNKNTVHTQLVTFLLGDLNIRAHIPTDNIIKSQSNLNSTILREILSVIGVDYSPYELKEKYIDSQLLRIRNSVAHGQDPDINQDEFYELYTEITTLITSIKNEITNNAALSNYQKKTVA